MKNTLFFSIFLLLSLTGAWVRASASDVASKDRQHQELRLKQFVVMGYEGIVSGLKTGGGPYIQTLLDLIGVSGPQEKLISDIQSLSIRHPNIMDFADQVAVLLKENIPDGNNHFFTPDLVPTGPSIYSGGNLGNAFEHLTKGMHVTLYLRGGTEAKGYFEDFSSKKIWIRGAKRKFYYLDEVVALNAPQL